MQLGVLCGRDEPGNEWENFRDAFFECGEQNQFSTQDEFGELGPRYTCIETAIFPSGSTLAGTQTIPVTSASTDFAGIAVPQLVTAFSLKLLCRHLRDRL